MHKWFKYSKLRVFFIFVFGFNALEYFYSDVALFEVSEPRYVFLPHEFCSKIEQISRLIEVS